MRKILGITGPTGVGKSRLGMTLAEKMGTDIISADSAQIYIGMDIGWPSAFTERWSLPTPCRSTGAWTSARQNPTGRSRIASDII